MSEPTNGPRRGLPPEEPSDGALPDALFRPAPSHDPATPTGDVPVWQRPEQPRQASSSWGGEARDGDPRSVPEGRSRAARAVLDDPEPTGSGGSFGRSLALTTLSAIVPGSGLLGARQSWAKAVGAVTSLVFIAAIGLIGWSAFSDLGSLAGIAVDPEQLRRLSLILIGVGAVWVTLIAGTQVLTRPRRLGPTKKAVGAALVTILSLIISTPVAVAARYSFDQKKLVESVFQGQDQVKSSSRPTIVPTEADPWKEHPRLNILLLGGDNEESRDAQFGLRTDTIMVASIDTSTGRTTLIQIPRNVQRTPFPKGSEMYKLFPKGFKGPGDPEEWFVNGIWDSVERGDYPSVFVGQTYRGAEALKQGIEGITGLKMDYFVLLNIDGIQKLIDAMGGVTVNINERLPIAGNTQGKKPTGYLEPGPDQHLDGYHAMWYARSRSESTDYDRMARQSCLVNAIIKQANPTTMLTSYEAIAAASADMVLTDIPQEALQPMVKLSLKVQGADVERLVFAPGKNGYNYANPDFPAMRQAVQDAIATPETTAPSSTTSPDATTPGKSADPSAPATIVQGAQSVTDACAYNPK